MSRFPFSNPVVEDYDGISVVRDDLIVGGTKARFASFLFDKVDELVYASPCEGGAQTALAYAARELDKLFTLFVAKRKQLHPRVELSFLLGANVQQLLPGYLSQVQHAAKQYASNRKFIRNSRTSLLEFGLNSELAVSVIATAAKSIPKPRELWFAAGSGTLARGLARAWPKVPRFAVQVGHKLTTRDVAGAEIIVYPKEFKEEEKFSCPFPSDGHYDAKAFRICLERRAGKNVTFWNVAAPAEHYKKVLFPNENQSNGTISSP